jgi:outer membrane receptor protein involved in Fe transport
MAILVMLVVANRSALSAEISGLVTDRSSNNPIAGATIVIAGSALGGVTDSQGHYRISGVPRGRHTVLARSIGYDTVAYQVDLLDDEAELSLNFSLPLNPVRSREIIIRSMTDRETDASARMTERTAPNVLSVLSAQSIARYPDASTAEVAKRIPGLSITRVRGEARQVIVRGMEGRYNNTLIDGVKMPSPSTNTHEVQLDYLASDLLQRVEVTKSLIPSMEADAIGGSVNLVMRSAPEHFLLRTRVGTGYNSTLLHNDLVSFRTDSIQADPLEIHGRGYQSRPEDFTRDNLKLIRGRALPDLIAECTVGDRLIDGRIGFIAGGSLQRSSQHSETVRNYDAVDADNTLFFVRRQYRLHGHEKTRWGATARIDYLLDENNTLQISCNGFMRQNLETRLINDTNLVYSPVLYLGSRTVYQIHSLADIVLSGNHSSGAFKLNWRGGWAEATQSKPDRAEFTTTQALVGDSVVSAPVFYSLSRDWQHNDDRDLFAGGDLEWKGLSASGLTVTAGMLVRGKERSNYQNEYRLQPVTDSLNQVPLFRSIDETRWQVENTGGTPQYASNNYTCRENVTGVYLMGSWSNGDWNVLAGARLEATAGTYSTYDARRMALASASKYYTDLLPSISLRYALSAVTNIRLGAGQTISRPNYFDLVPYNFIGEEVREMGNPKLRRTISTNVDLKFETFPGVERRFSVGAFYKSIVDPIESTLDISDPALPTIIPKNLGVATNFGVEVVAGTELLEYFTLQANYTYTHSTITSDKLVNDRAAGRVLVVPQSRPLQGQSEHVGNLALGFSHPFWGTTGQLSFTFTGRRIAEVSAYMGLDHYESDFPLLDLSLEQHLAGNLSLFLRLNNLLNARYEVRVLDGPLIEQEQFGQTATLGFNYHY